MISRWFVYFACVFLLALGSATGASGQGPAPESAPPLFPGGALISYNSVFTTRGSFPGAAAGSIPVTAFPTFSHEGDFNFTWGFHTDLDFTIVLPIVTTRFDQGAGSTVGGAGLGDAIAMVKYRFYRRDSARGTTQASLSIGSKFPTGRTNLDDESGNRLPTGLQPGSGSFDLFLAGDWTYTGLFGYRRLVADEDFHALLRSQGSQQTRLGSNVESRFWLSYRPYESKDVRREWFIGPALTWLHSGKDRIAGAEQDGSGGDVLMTGVTTYAGVRPGMHVWVATDWDVVHSTGAQFMPVRRHISFGITQQFRLHFR